MKRLAALGGAALLAAATAAAQGAPPLEAPPALADETPQPATDGALERLWAQYGSLDAAGDAEGAQRALAGLARLRAERNIFSLESMGLALVGKGVEQIGKGDSVAAERYFRGAAGLDPYLADARFGLGRARVGRDPLGLVPAAREMLAGIAAQGDTWLGSYRLWALLVPAGFLALVLTTLAVAVALLAHYGGLLLHDLEEEFGPRRGPLFARALFALLLVLPVALLQGFAWLPLWWLALVFVYLRIRERLVVGLLLAGTLAVGPLARVLEVGALTGENPLFRAGLQAVRGEPDARTARLLEKAMQQAPDDRDFAYLLARQHRKAGRTEEAAALYRALLGKDPKDPVALNNLANLDFARGDFAAAKARYKQGTQVGAPAETTATLYYNLSIAHLQKFEFEPATEARAQADRLAGGLTRSYESLWRYDKGGAAVAAVVDLGLSEEQLAAKFSGQAEGIPRQNVASGKAAPGTPGLWQAALNRFGGFALVFAAAVLALSSWRGRKLFTLRCAKCGTAFCKRCHLGQVSGGLCTQCYHLFVVKDGVSLGAKNQKVREVAAEAERRKRLFRSLSLVSPGAGQVYGRQLVPGFVLALLWYGVLSVALLAWRPLGVTDAPSRLTAPWVALPAALLLGLVYLVANRWPPKFEVPLPVIKRAPSRRAAAHE